MTSLYFKGGSSDRFYVDFSMSHMPPILSGDNFRFGIGAGQPGYDLWADIGFGMYDAPGVLFRAKLKLDPNFSLITYGRYMESERIHEYTLNFGLNYRFNK